MAAFTSKATGNASASGQTTWNEAGVPSSSDTVTVNSGHTITIDVDTTWSAITAMNGPITIADGKRLTVSADSTQGNATLTGGANSILELDPGSGTLIWTMGTANSQSSCKIVTSGTSAGNPFTIRKKSGATGKCYFEDFGHGAGNFDTTTWDVQYCNLTNITNSDNTLGIRINTFGTASVRFRNCVFDGCGTVKWFYDQSDVSGKYSTFQDCKWQNTPSGSLCISQKMNNAGALTDDYSILRCVFDVTMDVTKAIKVRINDNYFDNYFNTTGSMAGGEFKRNGIRMSSNSQSVTMNISTSDCYFLHDQTTGNPHFMGSAGAVSDLVHERHVLECPHPTTFDTGDGILGIDCTNMIVRYCLMLAGSDGKVSGFLLNQGTTTSTPGNVKAHHNTVVGEFAMCCYIKDPGYIANGPVYSEAKSNLVYSPSTGFQLGSYVAYDLDLANTPHDVLTGTGATHNGIYNGDTYTDPTNGNAVYTGYRAKFPTSGTPGSNDVLADPQFVDYGRNFAGWAVYKGAASGGDSLATKIAAARALLRADPTLVYTDLMPWVKAGYAPTNPAYQNAGHDGVTIGAVEFVAAGGVTTLPLIGGGLVNGGLISKGLIQ